MSSSYRPGGVIPLGGWSAADLPAHIQHAAAAIRGAMTTQQFTAVPTPGVTLAQVTAALHALGFNIDAGLVRSVSIDPGRVVIVGYLDEDARGRAIPTRIPYTEDTFAWRVEAPIVTAPPQPEPPEDGCPRCLIREAKERQIARKERLAQGMERQ